MLVASIATSLIFDLTAALLPLHARHHQGQLPPPAHLVTGLLLGKFGYSCDDLRIVSARENLELQAALQLQSCTAAAVSLGCCTTLLCAVLSIFGSTSSWGSLARSQRCETASLQAQLGWLRTQRSLSSSVGALIPPHSCPGLHWGQALLLPQLTASASAGSWQQSTELLLLPCPRLLCALAFACVDCKARLRGQQVPSRGSCSRG